MTQPPAAQTNPNSENRMSAFDFVDRKPLNNVMPRVSTPAPVHSSVFPYHTAGPGVARREVDDLVVLRPQHRFLLVAVLLGGGNSHVTHKRYLKGPILGKVHFSNVF